MALDELQITGKVKKVWRVEGRKISVRVAGNGGNGAPNQKAYYISGPGAGELTSELYHLVTFEQKDQYP